MYYGGSSDHPVLGRFPRSPADGAREPLAAAPLDAAVDAGRHARRRRRAVVRTGPGCGALRRAQRFHALLAATLAVATGVTLFLELKRAFRRKRPCALEPHCWADLLPPDQFSFSSGHTITAFAVAVSLGGFYPEMLPGLLFSAISIAASRVVLGMHFLSDVLAGAALGATLGAIATALIS